MNMHVTTLGMLVIAPTLFAQGTEPRDTRTTRPMADMQQQEQTADYVKLDKLIGADVKLKASAEERREAAEEGDEADRPTGEIKDLIVEFHTGKTAWAIMGVDEGILGIGGKNVAVPTKALRWNAADEVFELDVTEERLKSLPEFDLDAAQEGKLDATVSSLKSNWKDAVGERDRELGEAAVKGEREIGAVEGAAEKAAEEARRAGREVEEELGTEEERGVTMPRANRRYVCASQIDDLPVYAQASEFGDVEAVLVDRANHRVDLLIVGHGGTLGMGEQKILLPYDGLMMCRKSGADADEEDADALAFAIDRPAAELAKSAVKYEEPESGAVDPNEAKRAKSTFGAKKHSGMRDADRDALDKGARDPGRGERR